MTTSVNNPGNLAAAINHQLSQCLSQLNNCFFNLPARDSDSPDARYPGSGLVVTVVNETGSGAEASPLTEFYNGVTDWLFGSVQNDSTLTGCSGGGGYINSFDITKGFPASAAAVLNVAGTGGSSGIIIDKSGSATGESQIYYSSISSGSCTTSGGSGGCGIQAAQNGL